MLIVHHTDHARSAATALASQLRGELERLATEWQHHATQQLAAIKVCFCVGCACYPHINPPRKTTHITQVEGAPMRFDDTTGAAHVTFSEALVTLLADARRLESLGVRMPPTLQQQLTAARRLHRHGLVLHQVADFYNELGARILPCHKSMLLADAQAFESVLLAPRDGGGRAVTWDNAPAVEGYVRRLQGAVQQLTDRNRYGVVREGWGVPCMYTTCVVAHCTGSYSCGTQALLSE